MHIPDGFLDPKISYGLIGAAVGALAYALAKVKQAVTELAPQESLAAAGRGIKSLAGKGRRVLSQLGEQKVYQMGMVAALVFAAQMFNFPVDQGTSGHLIGAALATVLLGPFMGLLVVASVVIIQALFFADGGLIAMGANVINMAVIASLVSYYLYAWTKRYLPEWLSVFIAAWFSVMTAALAASLEIAFSGTFALGAVLSAMLTVHAVIGLAEGLITLALVRAFWLLVRVGEE
ncbi:MAG: energy-coupling factor ABC transporter permease [Candidatus Saganbacteria bacterium]|nr:energy-coupling factor ABC transporter permease [Candidatus Saganbacteria bacterium]